MHSFKILYISLIRNTQKFKLYAFNESAAVTKKDLRSCSEGPFWSIFFYQHRLYHGDPYTSEIFTTSPV